MAQESSTESQEKRRWLRMAAEEGHVPAMYDLSAAIECPREREKWLREAARNGWEAAVVELCES
jgi:hypothetical protein